MKINAIKTQISLQLFKNSKKSLSTSFCGTNEQESDSFKCSKENAKVICRIVSFVGLVIAALLLVFHSKK